MKFFAFHEGQLVEEGEGPVDYKGLKPYTYVFHRRTCRWYKYLPKAKVKPVSAQEVPRIYRTWMLIL